MVKGFTDKQGKFRPTGNNGTSSKDKSIETTGVKLDRQDRRQKFTTTGIEPSRLSLTIGVQEENIASGEEVIEKFQKALDERDDDFFKGKSIQAFIDDNSEGVTSKWLENLGRDEHLFRDFLDNRLDKTKGEWNLAVPISTFGAYEDSLSGNYTTMSYKGRLWWARIHPEDFLDLASNVGTFDEKTIMTRQDDIKNGKQISTPQLDLTWNEDQKKWAVRGHEGRHRAEASKREGLSAIPVWLETDIEIWQMTEEQENALKEIQDEGINALSFITEQAG